MRIINFIYNKILKYYMKILNFLKRFKYDDRINFLENIIEDLKNRNILLTNNLIRLNRFKKLKSTKNSGGRK